MTPAPPPRRKRRGCLTWALALYALLLLASHIERRVRPEPPPEPAAEGREVVRLAPRGGDGAALEGDPVSLAYRRWGERAGAAGPVLVLLHGSPGSADDFDALAPALEVALRRQTGRSWLLLAPDLPGFGAGSREVPDYSIAAHAAYTFDLLDRLGVERFHLLGFSMGGGVALEMLDEAQAPKRAASLTLLSSLGVEELELLGSRRFNHALHGLQLGIIRAAIEGIPHFGALDGGMLGVPYARNFYDTDQRPLRRILGEIDLPVLVVHGEDDVLVPVEAARESARLAPQAELVLVPANHFMVFRGGDEIVEPVAGFLERAAAGRGRRRADASPEALARSREPYDPSMAPRAAGIALVVLMLLLALSTLVSEDLTCIAAGVLVAQGRIAFWPATIACLVGIFVGDMLLYLAGRFLGRPWLDRAPLKWWVNREKVERGESWFRRRGPAVIFLSRFTPGTRLATYVAAGLLRAGLGRFLLWFLLAAALWTPMLIYVASLVGEATFGHFETASAYALPVLVAVIAGVWAVAKVGPMLFTWKGRRRLAGAWRRLTHWEFWPPWAFYPPVAVYLAYLALKHRSPTLFTAADPGIPAGGFIGESKGEILDQLDPSRVARYRRFPAGLDAGEVRRRVEAFMEEEGLGLPVVLKPDQGQRGAGVRVARTWDEVDAAARELAGTEGLVQEYVGGVELGIFYVRMPPPPEVSGAGASEPGWIFSITDKRLPTVEGDGRHTVEHLVLAHPRAVAMARFYLGQLGERAREVPAAGEEVRLTDLGTHCRGAVFLDGIAYRTPALEAWVEETSRSFPGFYFGRYDLRAPSYEAFREGRDIRVLELNGVTSEATHIYDPGNSLGDAYRILFEQWRLAYEIGRRNRAAGAQVTGPVELLRRVWAFRRRGAG